MHEDRMTEQLIGELYRSYMRGELTLEHAAEQIFVLMRRGRAEGTGFSVDTNEMASADQERTFALFGRLKWHALQEALPGTELPPMTAQEFLADLHELEKEQDTE
jgi:hypothetical protein